MSRPQVWPRACTSAPPSLNFPSLMGANPSFLAKSATGAIASSSSLDRKTTRWPPSTIGSVASVAATKWLKPFTNLAPVNDFATNAEDGRPSSSSGGTRNGHVDVFTGEGVGEGLTYLSESYNCIAHNVSPILVDIDSQPSTARTS